MRLTGPILNVAALVAAAQASADEGSGRVQPVDVGSVVVTARSATPATPHIYETIALDAGVTPYGARWRRVSAADERDPRVRAAGAAVMAAASDPVARLALVQSEVARKVRWRRDLETYRVSDYWAQAGETLNRGEGDSEDIAILKMQILKAAGIPARDIYLSVGRDKERGSDTMLLVRVGSQFYALDDREARPVLANGRRQFTPIFTLGKNSAWIHGSRVATRGADRPARVTLARSLAR